ncbi:hypothetical protein [Halegenticoccus tardaugens]|uniref:hypothetical protein n=1 Tax=Halegenticoccus tardaugens TaxID=2071624 RepID=UPI00100BC7BC|nr:hypothetical protein [Halegenticoccus tardaugens]
MSADDGGPGRREVAYRLFAAEYDDASLSYSESDEERAPNYVVTPTGLRVNRLFAVGVLTEVERVNDDVLRGRIADPTGAFVTYAGQYQPDAAAFFERTAPPAFVSLTGKARTFEPEDSDRVYTSVRPESVNVVDADTRDRWVVSTAEATLRRVGVFAEALETDVRGDDLREALLESGANPALAAGIPLAIDHYGTTTAYLEAVRRLAVDALEVVAGDRDGVRPLDLAPGEGGEATLGPLPGDGFEIDAGAATEERAAVATTDATSEPESARMRDSTESAESAEAAANDDVSTDEAEAEATSASDADGDLSDREAGSTPDLSGDETDSTSALGDFDDDSTSDLSGDEAGSTPDLSGDSAGSTTNVDELDEEGLYELDEEERREVEEEFGTEFTTGSSVDAPGEAGIDVPDADELADETNETNGAEGDPAGSSTDEPAAASTDESTGSEPESESEPETEPKSDPEAADVNLEAAAVATMEELDAGDGAERDRVVAAVVDEHGADPDAVEDAIQDALMSGQCYEPDEGRLKAI